MDVRRARPLPDDLPVVERPRLVEGVEPLDLALAAAAAAHERPLAAVVQDPLRGRRGGALLRRVRVRQRLVGEDHVLLFGMIHIMCTV